MASDSRRSSSILRHFIPKHFNMTTPIPITTYQNRLLFDRITRILNAPVLCFPLSRSMRTHLIMLQWDLAQSRNNPIRTVYTDTYGTVHTVLDILQSPQVQFRSRMFYTLENTLRLAMERHVRRVNEGLRWQAQGQNYHSSMMRCARCYRRGLNLFNCAYSRTYLVGMSSVHG
jgi:hypothetical protein